MLIVKVKYNAKPEVLAAYLKKIEEEGLADACRNEEGNIEYNYYYPVGKTDELMLLEMWESKDALKLHQTFPHYARLGEVKQELGVDVAIKIFPIEPKKEK